MQGHAGSLMLGEQHDAVISFSRIVPLQAAFASRSVIMGKPSSRPLLFEKIAGMAPVVAA